jgi:hypothetical protein
MREGEKAERRMNNSRIPFWLMEWPFKWVEAGLE